MLAQCDQIGRFIALWSTLATPALNLYLNFAIDCVQHQNSSSESFLVGMIEKLKPVFHFIFQKFVENETTVKEETVLQQGSIERIHVSRK